MKIPVSHIIANECFRKVTVDLNEAVNSEMHKKNVHQKNPEIVEKMDWLMEHDIDYKIYYELNEKETIKPAGHIVDGRDLWDDFDFYRCFVTMFFEFDTYNDAVFFKISN